MAVPRAKAMNAQAELLKQQAEVERQKAELLRLQVEVLRQQQANYTALHSSANSAAQSSTPQSPMSTAPLNSMSQESLMRDVWQIVDSRKATSTEKLISTVAALEANERLFPPESDPARNDSGADVAIREELGLRRVELK